MDGGRTDVCGDVVAVWQRMLNRHRRFFDPLVAGASVGIAPRHVVDGAPGGAMMVWCRRDAGMAVEARPFAGFADCGVDLLFVAEPGALEGLEERLEDNAMGAMKLAVRDGRLLLYVIKPKTQLLDDGYEDFLEVLGLAFLGACR